MSPQEFARQWSALRSKLTTEELHLLDDVLAGAEANHSLVYMLVTFVLGVLAGASAWALLG